MRKNNFKKLDTNILSKVSIDTNNYKAQSTAMVSGLELADYKKLKSEYEKYSKELKSQVEERLKNICDENIVNAVKELRKLEKAVREAQNKLLEEKRVEVDSDNFVEVSRKKMNIATANERLTHHKRELLKFVIANEDLVMSNDLLKLNSEIHSLAEEMIADLSDMITLVRTQEKLLRVLKNFVEEEKSLVSATVSEKLNVVNNNKVLDSCRKNVSIITALVDRNLV